MNTLANLGQPEYSVYKSGIIIYRVAIHNSLTHKVFNPLMSLAH